MEVETLLNDLFNAYRSQTQTQNDVLFAGQIFLRKQGKGSDGVKDKYEVVDGQQRLTTLSMLLISIYSLARSRGFEDTDKDISDLKSFLWKYSRSAQNYLPNERLITLSSIDKDIFIYLFDAAYSNPQQVKKTFDGYTIRCDTERNIKSMFHLIYERIENEIPFDGANKIDIINFLDFILEKTVFITIQSSIDMAHVFGVFESINSKGKPLEDIDKIKTYIFAKLDESDYSTYLTRWGQLIIKTNDQLTDYLKTYINAFLFFYKQKINIVEFKNISKQLTIKYGFAEEKEALKKLIDDMLGKVENYNLLNNEEELEKRINKPAFTTFSKLYNAIGYEHPRPLLFRAICDLNNIDEAGKESPLITKDNLLRITRSSTLFLFKFQSIRGGDSKDAIKYFKEAAESYYDSTRIDGKKVEKIFSNALVKEGVNKNIIKSSFMNIDFYSKHDLAYCVLSLLESIDEKKNKLLYSQASMMLSHMKDQTFQIDHMLPQHPDKNDKNFCYYSTKINNQEILVLKKKHDFPLDIVVDGMRYEEFESRTLNKLGNIRLFLPQLNGEKGNIVCQIPDHENFNKYQQIVDRCDKLADLLCNSKDLS